MNKEMVLLIVLSVALTGHYFSQRLLFVKGQKTDNRKPYIRRMIINAVTLIIVAGLVLLRLQHPLNLISALLFFEAVACLFFSWKLSRK